MPDVQGFHDFILMNDLLQSSHGLMLIKQNKKTPLIYHITTSATCIGCNSIRIFYDIKVLSQLHSKPREVSSAPHTYILPRVHNISRDIMNS